METKKNQNIGQSHRTLTLDQSGRALVRGTHRQSTAARRTCLRQHLEADIMKFVECHNEDPKALAWQAKIAEFDAYIFIVAEYNHSITGVLKNALD